MKTIIAGSRDIRDFSVLMDALQYCPFKHMITSVVSGTARGVDTLGEQYAKQMGYPIHRFPAIWEDEEGNKNPAAGHQRNARMAEFADALVAIWDGSSSGTKNMIAEAKRRGLQVHIHVDSNLFSWD